MIAAVDEISPGLTQVLCDRPVVDRARLRSSLLDEGVGADSPRDRRDRDRAAHMLLRFERPAEVLDLALDHLVAERGCARGDAGFAAARDEVYRPTVVVGEHDGAASVAETPLPNHHPVLQSTWRAPGAVGFDEVQRARSLGELRGLFGDLGSTAMLATSIDVEGLGVGLLCIDEVERARVWTPDDREHVDQFVARWLAPVLGASLVAWARRRRLTRAERQAVELLAVGLSYAEIADELGRSVRTVDNQLRSARRRLDARNAIELVRRAGLLQG
ncbi:MAG: helix-turn-helix transcriptional regulator [Actinomycetota bacterium]